MVKGKKLVSLISTEGKTPEEICKEATEAFEKFKKAHDETEKTVRGKKKDKQ